MDPLAQVKFDSALPEVWLPWVGKCLFPWEGAWPNLAPDVTLAPGARVIGRVALAAGVSVWYNAVIRGDINTISLGERANVQDNATLHVSHGAGCLRIGAEVVIGHGALVHACQIADQVLVGMGAIVLDGANIGSHVIIAAGAVVPPRMIIPSGVLVAGVPAKILREISQQERESIAITANQYFENAKNLRSQLDFIR